MNKEEILQKWQGVHDIIQDKLDRGLYLSVELLSKTAGDLKHEYNKK